MSDKRSRHIVVALCTSAALIAFAIYQSYRAVAVSTSAFFVVAAIICLTPVLHGLFRHKTCQNKSPVS